eukprot:gnl/MRDRNA2_/MRDRNA2_335756_c0_seq1.p1 gnl/MRDRNA2_/MRDRNA2_335756_c0~~gnl/MRDRNA2_/MRDRNA2_335756_c0_seq1.p1  ORF type:complete len:165 (-),score=24.57 gnl/MRDRNA2_/MRDRNA2_335756_c0_seq1:175-669(-)
MVGLTSSPVESLGILCLLIAVLTLFALMSCAGSKWCPVATSTTLYIASSMICGYSAQTLFFGMVPQLLTIIGSVLMFCSVFTMAVARVVQPRRTSADQQEAASAGDSNDAAEIEGIRYLTNFIADELVEVLPLRSSVRHRCNVNVSEPAAEEIGLPGMVLVAAA